MKNIMAVVLVLFALSANAETNNMQCGVMSSRTQVWNMVIAPMVYFSPSYGGGDCSSNLVSEIGKAKKTIRVSAFQFTLPSVADALINAKKNGVDVQMIIDHSALDGKNSKVWNCGSNGIPVYIDKKHNIFHNKMTIIDECTVITGSFNYTANAEYHNAENLWVIVDTNAAALCVSNWMIHFSHSVPLK